MPELCPACLAKGEKNILKLQQINFEEAFKMCSNDMCTYPIGSDGLNFNDNYYVKRSYTVLTRQDRSDRQFLPKPEHLKKLDERLKSIEKVLNNAYKGRTDNAGDFSLTGESNKEFDWDELMDLMKCNEDTVDSEINFDPNSLNDELDFLISDVEEKKSRLNENKSVLNEENIDPENFFEDFFLPPSSISETGYFSSFQTSDINENAVVKENPTPLNIIGHNPQPLQDSDHTVPLSHVVEDDNSPISIIEGNTRKLPLANDPELLSETSAMNDVSVAELLQQSEADKESDYHNPLQESANLTDHFEESNCVSLETNKPIANQHSSSNSNISHLGRENDFVDNRCSSEVKSLINEKYTSENCAITSEEGNSDWAQISSEFLNDISLPESYSIYTKESSGSGGGGGECEQNILQEQGINGLNAVPKDFGVNDKNLCSENDALEDSTKGSIQTSRDILNTTDGNLKVIDEITLKNGEQTAVLTKNKSAKNENSTLDASVKPHPPLGSSQNDSEMNEISMKTDNITTVLLAPDAIQSNSTPQLLNLNSHIDTSVQTCKDNKEMFGHNNLDPIGTENCLDLVKQSLPSATVTERSFKDPKYQNNFGNKVIDTNTDINVCAHSATIEEINSEELIKIVNQEVCKDDKSLQICNSSVSSHPLEMENSVMKNDFAITKINNSFNFEDETIKDYRNAAIDNTEHNEVRKLNSSNFEDKTIKDSRNAAIDNTVLLEHNEDTGAEDGKKDVGIEHVNQVYEKSHCFVCHDHSYFTKSSVAGNCSIHNSNVIGPFYIKDRVLPTATVPKNQMEINDNEINNVRRHYRKPLEESQNSKDIFNDNLSQFIADEESNCMSLDENKPKLNHHSPSNTSHLDRDSDFVKSHCSSKVKSLLNEKYTSENCATASKEVNSNSMKINSGFLNEVNVNDISKESFRINDLNTVTQDSGNNTSRVNDKNVCPESNALENCTEGTIHTSRDILNAADENQKVIDEITLRNGEQTAILTKNKSAKNYTSTLETNSFGRCSDLKSDSSVNPHSLGLSQNRSEENEISMKNENKIHNITVVSLGKGALPRLLNFLDSHSDTRVPVNKNIKEILGHDDLDRVRTENLVKQSLSCTTIKEDSKYQDNLDDKVIDTNTNINVCTHSATLSIKNSVMNSFATIKINNSSNPEVRTTKDSGNAAIDNTVIVEHNEDVGAEGREKDVGIEHMNHVYGKSDCLVCLDHSYFKKSNVSGNCLIHNGSVIKPFYLKDRVLPTATVTSNIVPKNQMKINDSGINLNSDLQVTGNNSGKALNMNGRSHSTATVISERIQNMQTEVNATVHFSANNNVNPSLVPTREENSTSLRTSSTPKIRLENCNSSLSSFPTKSQYTVLASASRSIDLRQNLEVAQFSFDLGNVSVNKFSELDLNFTDGNIIQDDVSTLKTYGKMTKRRKCKNMIQPIKLEELKFGYTPKLPVENPNLKQVYFKYKIPEDGKVVSVDPQCKNMFQRQNVTAQNCYKLVEHANVSNTIRNMPIRYLPGNSQFQEGNVNTNQTPGVSCVLRSQPNKRNPKRKKNALSSKTEESYLQKVKSSPVNLELVPNTTVSANYKPLNIAQNTSMSTISVPIANSFSNSNISEDKESMNVLHSGTSQLKNSKKNEQCFPVNDTVDKKSKRVKITGFTQCETFEGFSFGSPKKIKDRTLSKEEGNLRRSRRGKCNAFNCC